MKSVLFEVFEKDVIKTSFIIQQDTLPHSVYRASDYVAKSLKSSVLRSVLFDELPSLRGLPQQMSEVVRVVLGVALCGGHPGNRAPVNDTGGNTFNTANKRKTKKEKKQCEKGDETIHVGEKYLILFIVIRDHLSWAWAVWGDGEAETGKQMKSVRGFVNIWAMTNLNANCRGGICRKNRSTTLIFM